MVKACTSTTMINELVDGDYDDFVFIVSDLWDAIKYEDLEEVILNVDN